MKEVKSTTRKTGDQDDNTFDNYFDSGEISQEPAAKMTFLEQIMMFKKI